MKSSVNTFLSEEKKEPFFGFVVFDTGESKAATGESEACSEITVQPSFPIVTSSLSDGASLEGTIRKNG